ncbi:MAG: hypothetical protein SGJ13_13490 [Actinomycetota bacterium]|nr:hypothetical protein [Actinomycetota bacterium]
MDDNWGYVVAGYVITIAVLSAYGGWMWFRLRRARRADLDH